MKKHNRESFLGFGLSILAWLVGQRWDPLYLL